MSASGSGTGSPRSGCGRQRVGWMRERRSSRGRWIGRWLNGSFRWRSSRLTNPLSNRSVAVGPGPLLFVFRRGGNIHRHSYWIWCGWQGRVIGCCQTVTATSVGPRRFLSSAELEHVPVENVIIGETLPMEKVSEKVPQIWIVRLLFKA